MNKEKHQLEIVGISYSQTQSGAYALILGEVNGNRRIPIIIGTFEAQAIAIELEKMKPARPLTHDLFKTFALEYDINIIEVVINKFEDGVFYARIVCSDGKKQKEIDARTSDAVAMAVRFNCPIYTYKKVLDETSMVKEDEKEEKAEEDIPENESTKTAESMEQFSDEDLEKMLKDAIDDEDYEKASKYRDELKRRK
jgi:bifunctional DNase/RNase